MRFSNFNDFKNFLSDKYMNKIFILSGLKSFKKSGAQKLLSNSLENKETFFFFKKEKIPKIIELKKIIYLLDKFKPDLFLAIGGGSVLDYAKIANVFELDKDLENSIKKNKIHFKEKKFKLAVVPTTAGSGAEVTSNAVIYLKDKKFSVENKLIAPDYFFLIPELVISNNKIIKASSGFDCIAQSLESIISVNATNRSLKFAKDSLKISFNAFEKFASKADLENARKMCIAANLSGKAIDITKTTAPHAISYPFTYHFGINHGHAVSLTLNEFINFNYKFMNYSKVDLKHRFKDIFNIFNVNNISELDTYLNNLKKKIGLEFNFRKLGINYKKDINQILSGINLLRLKNNPVKLEMHTIKSIILKISKK